MNISYKAALLLIGIYIQAAISCVSNPTANLKIYPNGKYVIKDKKVLLDGSGSLAGNGASIIRYEWDFGNGKYEYAEGGMVHPDGTTDGKTYHTFTSTGTTFTIRLKVTNSYGVSNTTSITSFNVSVDTGDNDGLPNAWETAYGVSNPAGNDDGDIYTNIQEYLHGSIPKGPGGTASIPQAGIIVAHGGPTPIQDTINASLSGDKIIVLPGDYIENVTLNVNNRTLQSLDPDNWEIVQKTIIMSDEDYPSNPILTIGNSANATTIVQGFSITKGYRGIQCEGSPIIEKCIINNNYSYGIYFGNSTQIKNCYIVNNKGDYSGGGLFAYSGSPKIFNSVIIGNNASSNGGAILNDSSLEIRNCSIVSNTATSMYNGGLYQSSGSAQIYNTIFWGNSGNQIAGNTQNVSLTNCNMANPSSVPTDPLFVDIGDIFGKDGILGTKDDGLILRTNSPCVNAGNNTYAESKDIIGQTRTGNADIGAYELSRIIYVKQTGTGDGTTWGNAASLAGALSNAQAGDEIWCQQGTYRPDGLGRYSNFHIPANVSVYGRFYGNETALINRKAQYETVISGDRRTDDIANFGNREDNCYHVVTGDFNSVIDGFKIKGGYAEDSGSDGLGAGIYNSAMTVLNCFFEDNYAQNKGAGIWSGASSMKIINCVFKGNQAGYKGGAIATGYVNYGNLAEITNCTISGNTAPNGGGISGESELPLIENTIIYGNSGSSNPNFYFNNTLPLVFNCDIQGCKTGGNWNPACGNDEGCNIDSNPSFVSTSDFRLQHTVPANKCINGGNNAFIHETFDIAQNKRIINKIVDMGAYEGAYYHCGEMFLLADYDQENIIDPVNYGWQNESFSCSPMTYSIRFKVENSAEEECNNGSNLERQYGLCKIIMYLPLRAYNYNLTVTVAGVTEKQNRDMDFGSIYVTEDDLQFGTDLLNFWTDYLAGDEKVYIESENEGYECVMEVLQNESSSITLEPGVHNIWFWADTKDEQWHQGVYFNFSITVE